jgi:hypothetical protein
MKKFTSLLIGVSLALAGAAFAQQPEESPAKGKKPGTEKTTQQAEPKTPKTHGANAANPEATAKTGAQTGAGATTGAAGKGLKAHEKPATATGAGPETGAQTGAGATTETGAGPGKGKGRMPHEKPATATGTGTETGVNPQTGAGATTETGAKGKHGRAKTETSAATGTSASAEAGASASVPPGGTKGGHGEKGMKAGAGANAKASASAAPTVAAAPSAAPSVAATGATGQQNAGANVAATGAATTHVDTQKVQQVKQQTAQIKQQHVNFKAQPRPDRAPAVTFNASFRIEGSDRWSGPQYEVFRAYHPERHDRGWYHQRYQRVELIAGGYYFWNNGYWYPAWGYDPGHEYYAYDAPIYVGHRAEPPDRVIADVQAELQEMGYYQGEVDGLLGPITRQALTDYQADQGLQVTAVIDEPTLDSLGMG